MSLELAPVQRKCIFSKLLTLFGLRTLRRSLAQLEHDESDHGHT